ncbi:MAG TPA: hypothetical protein VN641_02675 [Urbifossiella sp.]|nr:hypothetical protein [Urbifossiella sp.]
MPVWLLKLCHWMGVTELTDEQVARYAAIKSAPAIAFTDAPILKTHRATTFGEAKPTMPQPRN